MVLLNKPNQSYFLCTSPRTGSELLCEILTLTTVAGKPGEFFFPERFPHFFKYYRISTLSEYIDIIFSERTTANGVFGVKMMTGGYLYPFIDQCRQLSHYEGRSLETHQLLEDLFPNLKYIFLTRRDKVRQAISHWRAIQSDIWHRTTTQKQGVEDDPVEFVFDSVDHLVQNHLLREVVWQDFFEQTGAVPLTVVYEDFIQEPELTALRILDFLQISPPPGWHLKTADIINIQLSDNINEAWIHEYRQIKQFGWEKPIW